MQVRSSWPDNSRRRKTNAGILALAAALCVAALGIAPRAHGACPRLTWSLPVPIFSGVAGREVRALDLEWDGNRVVAIWLWTDVSSTTTHLYWSFRDTQGWSAPALVDPQGGAATFASPVLAAGDDGTLAASWTRSTQAMPAVQISLLRPGAVAWEPPLTFDRIPGSNRPVGLAAVHADSLWVFDVGPTQLRAWPVVQGQVDDPVVLSSGWPLPQIPASHAQAFRSRDGGILVYWTDEFEGGLEFRIVGTWLTTAGFGAIGGIPWYGPSGEGSVVENDQRRMWMSSWGTYDFGPADVRVVERIGDSWTDGEHVFGRNAWPVPEGASDCNPPRIVLMRDGQPAVVCQCHRVLYSDENPVWVRVLGGADWCPAQRAWPSGDFLTTSPVDLDGVSPPGAWPLIGFAYGRAGQIFVSEVIESVGLAAEELDPPPDGSSSEAQLDGAPLIVSRASPRDLLFCRGSAVGALAIELFDLAGRRVATLDQLHDDDVVCARWHAVDANGQAVAAGTYFYRAFAPHAPRRIVAAGKLAVLAP